MVDVISAAAARSNEEITEQSRSALPSEGRRRRATSSCISGEVSRRQAYRDDGATSAEAWAVERFGVSTPTARALTRLGEKAWDLPQLVGSLCAGDVSLDKVRAVADVATPESDAELCARAQECTVRELADVARTRHRRLAAPSAPLRSTTGAYLRFNEACRTVSVQLPPESFAETRACLEARARAVPSDGETPWDQRLCDAFVEVIRSSAPGAAHPGTPAASASPYVVVVHVPLEALLDESGEGSALAGELERDGLISTEIVRRIACDATRRPRGRRRRRAHHVRGPGPAHPL